MARIPHSIVIDGREMHSPVDARMKHWRTPGVSVAVLRGGKTDWTATLGVTRSDGARLTATTPMQAASLSKPVTASLIAVLADRELVDLDTDVRAWLGPTALGRTEGSAPLTLRMLLEHRAGLGRPSLPGYDASGPLPTVEQVVDGSGPAETPAIVLSTPNGLGYSGAGYTVAQLVVEKATGRAFADLAEEHLFGPLEMRHTSFVQPSTATSGTRAHGHDGSGQRIAGGWRRYPEAAAAGLWTTPSDLARWAAALQRAASDEGPLASVRTSGLGMHPDAVAIPYVGSTASIRVHSHGRNDGFVCDLVVSPAGWGAVLMTNGLGGERLHRELLGALVQVEGWPAAVDNRPHVAGIAPLAPDAVAPFLGSYTLEHLAGRPRNFETLEVALEGDELVIRAPGGWFTELLPRSALSFDTVYPEPGGVQLKIADGARTLSWDGVSFSLTARQTAPKPHGEAAPTPQVPTTGNPRAPQP